MQRLERKCSGDQAVRLDCRKPHNDVRDLGWTYRNPASKVPESRNHRPCIGDKVMGGGLPDQDHNWVRHFAKNFRSLVRCQRNPGIFHPRPGQLESSATSQTLWTKCWKNRDWDCEVWKWQIEKLDCGNQHSFCNRGNLCSAASICRTPNKQAEEDSTILGSRKDINWYSKQHSERSWNERKQREMIDRTKLIILIIKCLC